MRKKFLIVASILLCGVMSLSAQSKEGLTLFRLGELDLAKKYFQEDLNTYPAEDNYFLGEIAYSQDNLAEAKSYYEKSAQSANPVFGEIGLAKLNLKSDPKEAKKVLEGIAKKNKKENAVLLQVAKAFFDNKMEADGEKVLDELMTAKNRDPYAFILKGEMLQEQGKIGDAAAQYDQAVMFDPNNIVGLIKSGLVYERINPNTALSNFKKALEIDPNNKTIMRFMAKTYTVNGRYPQAIALYKEYFASEKFNAEDTQNYARALYFNDNLKTAKEVLEKGLQVEPDNFVMNRLLMYTDDKLKDYAQGAEVANKFFALRDNKDGGYIAQDFITYGNILLKQDDKVKAMLQFVKATTLDPDNAKIYKDLAAELSSSKLYIEAVETMNKYISLTKDATAEDYYQLGRYNLLGAQTLVKSEDPEAQSIRQQMLVNADDAFSKVIELSPNSYLGYQQKADVNSLLDPDMKNDIAKNLYLKTLEIIKENGELEKRKNIVLNAYQFLAVYYYYQFDDTNSAESKEKSLEYCNLYSELNPDNTSINAIKEQLQ